MERTSVVSSNIASIGYSEGDQILEVEFLKGGVYQYTGVPRHVYESFMGAGSKGEFFAANIKKNFSFYKV